MINTPDHRLWLMIGSIFLSLSIDGGSILEGESHPSVCVDYGVVQKTEPEAVGKLCELSVLCFQELQEIVHLCLARLLVADLSSDRCVLFLGGFKADAQGVEAFLVFCLVEGNGGVLPDALLHHLRDDFHLIPVFALLGGQFRQVKNGGYSFLVSLDGFLPAGEQDVGGGHKPGFDVFLIEEGSIRITPVPQPVMMVAEPTAEYGTGRKRRKA